MVKADSRAGLGSISFLYNFTFHNRRQDIRGIWERNEESCARQPWKMQLLKCLTPLLHTLLFLGFFVPRRRCVPSCLPALHPFDALQQSWETKQSLRRETCLPQLWRPIRIHKLSEALVNGPEVVFRVEYAAVSQLPHSISLITI